MLFNRYVFGIALVAAFVFNYTSEPSQIIKADYYSVAAAANMNFWIQFIINLTVFVGVIFIARFAYLETLEYSIYNNQSLTGELELELNENKLLIISRNAKSEIDITSVKLISETVKYYFIYFDKELAVVIPKIVVGADDFVNEISAKTKINVC